MQIITKRARRFQFTLNEIDKYPQLVDAIKSRVSYKAMISCKEIAPSTGHPHIHVYALFSNPVRWRQVCGEHIEICRGSHKSNIEYITKNGEILDRCNIEEVRDTKMTGKELQMMDYDDVMQLAPGLVKTWKAIRYIEPPMTKDNCYKPNIKVYFVWGPSGAGKTKYVFDHLPENEEFDQVKYTNGFWMHTRPGVKVAWYDDFRDSHMKPSEFINFIDYYVHSLNVKGDQQYNRYELIFITSVQDPSEIYHNVGDEPRRQWLRRMEIIHIDDDDKTVEDTLAWK